MSALADFVRVRLSTEQRSRILKRVLEAKPGRTRKLVGTAAGVAVAAAAAALLVLAINLAPAAPPSPIAAEPTTGRWHATGKGGQLVELRGGQRLELGEATQLQVLDADETRVRLERGWVRCQAEATPELVIEAGNAEARLSDAVLTMQLEVDDAGPLLSLEVERGVVAVHRQGSVSSVRAGETWSSRPTPRAVEEPTPPERLVPPTPLVPDPGPARPTPAALWERAQQARIAGETAQAAKAYEALQREYPGDSRAGLAAFELGRIRLDSLDDPAGALRAFDFALANGSAAFFAEDAAAGRVTALDRLGDHEACTRARDAFLETRAQSPHAARLGRLCRNP